MDGTLLFPFMSPVKERTQLEVNGLPRGQGRHSIILIIPATIYLVKIAINFQHFV